MAEFITVASGKGGVGKTIITANLGAALAELSKRVLLVDMDTGLRNLDIALGMESDIVYDTTDVFEGRCEIADAVLKRGGSGELYFMPAPQSRSDRMITPERMKELKGLLSDSFDYVLFDAPAGIGRGFENAIAAADMGIIAATPEEISLRDADRAVSAMENAGIPEIRLVINRVRPELIGSGALISVDNCIDIVGTKLLGVIPEDETVLSHYPGGILADKGVESISRSAFINMAKRIMGEDVPLTDFSVKKKGFFARLKYVVSGK